MANFTTYPRVSQSPYQSNNMIYPQDPDTIIMEPWLATVDPTLREFSNPASSEQPLQRFLTEPGKPLLDLAFFQSPQFISLPHDMDGTFDPSYTPSHLQSYQVRHLSPALSQEQSSCSSISQPMDIEWSGDNYHSYNPLPSSRATSTSQGAPELSWDGNFGSGREPGRHINMSQVQGVPDAQDPPYEEDSGYTTTMEQKPQFYNVPETNIKAKTSFSSFQGLAIKDSLSLSPHDSSHIHVKSEMTGYPLSDRDADCEEEDDMEDEINTIVAMKEADAEANDGSYHPRAARSPRRRRPTRPTTPPSKRPRNKKTNNRSRFISPMQCRSCSHAPFKDADALERHTKSAHTRTYSCTFSFAGCESVFGSKNEWKRHVASQHLCLNYWECTLGGCGSRPKSSTAGKTSIFNRKDLFTQHLRRMHAPPAAKKCAKKIPKWENDINKLQVECLRTRREPPRSLACDRCNVTFDKENAWDQRMEHFARHAESGEDVTVDQGLVEWAIHEGVVKNEGRGLELVSSANLGRGFYEDAECEDDE